MFAHEVILFHTDLTNLTECASLSPRMSAMASATSSEWVSVSVTMCSFCEICVKTSDIW